MEGVVKNVIGKKGFGFIKANGEEYFFHRDDFNGHWNDLVNDHDNKKDQIPVTFEVRASSKGPRAANVRRTDYPNQAA